MQRFRWIALQGSSRGLLPPLLLFVFLITTSGIPALAADVSAVCGSSVARIVSIQGSIEVLRAHQNNWSRITRLDTSLCEGDKLRTGASSRAALFIHPETLVRVDQSTNVSVSQTAKETLVEFTQDDIVATSTSAHTCGGGYFITRFPRTLRVNTPHLNAAVEGTEFLVAMRCESTELSVFEGKVLATSAGSNDFPSQSVISGQTFTVGSGTPPAIKVLLKPADAVRWTLYYPPLTPAGIVVPEDCHTVAPVNRAACLIARAEQFLRAGQADEAQAQMADALSGAPDSSDAKALFSIISLVKNDKVEALRLAKDSVEANASSAPAWLALSYAQQADFKLEAALTSAQKSAELQSNALSLSRVAELQLSLGWTREAEMTARHAVAVNPSESRAHMILGFVHLAQINVREAREDFERAIELDSTEPLSRLGLGLAIIRKGNLTEGREQIEISVALDPTNSLIRSYVGKAYYEENTKDRDDLASTQFGLAKAIDPNDPTPWFYDAILKQSQNRSVEAVQLLEHSVALNSERAVYRSRLLLDQDRAARATGVARIYQDLSLSELATTMALKSLSMDPSGYSAHRLAADLYSNEARLGAARVSELLQAQLWQPANKNAVQPQLGEAQFLVLSGTGPPAAGFQEFNPLFEQDGLQLFGAGIYGNHDTWGEEMVLSGLREGSAVQIGQYGYSTEGFRVNDDLTQKIYTAFAQHDFSASTSAQMEARTSNTNRGDTTRTFDPFSLSSNLRIEDDKHQGRLGIRHAMTEQQNLLLSIAYEDARQSQTDRQVLEVPFLPLPIFNDNTLNSSHRAWLTELQYAYRGSQSNLVAGIGHLDQQFKTQFDLLVTFSDGSPLNQDSALFDSANRFTNAYAYSNFFLTPTLTFSGGISVDKHKEGSWFEDTQINPKVGLVWEALPGTTIRTAWFRYLRRALGGLGTLEPTQIAGFNQLYDDANATDSRSYGVGLDQRIGDKILLGGEVVERNLTFPNPPAVGTVAPAFLENWHERIGRAYVGWLIHPTLSVTAEYFYELQEITDEISTTGVSPSSLRTQMTPFTATYRHPTGFFTQVRTTYVEQVVGMPLSGVLVEQRDNFWTTDVSIGHRFRQYHSVISLNAKNVANEQFHFQDTNVGGSTRLPLIRPGRSLWLSVSFAL